MKQSLLSKYRTELMGFAVLWIAFLHAQMWFRFGPLQIFKRTGHGGVDIFFFLSSFGLYYAYQKGERGWSFIKKRLLRIIPIFVPIAIVRIIINHYDFTASFMLLSTYIFWIGWDRSMWFISGIILLYLITPWYLNYLTKGNEKKKTFLWVGITLIISILLRNTWQSVFFARVPIYLLGFYAGKLSYEEVIFDKRAMLYLCLSFVVGVILYCLGFYLDVEDSVLWGWGLYWYPNLFLVWPLCLFLSSFFDYLVRKGMSLLGSVLKQFGSVSLEFYLLHELCIRYFGNRIAFPYPYEYNGILENLLIILLTFIIAKIYHFVMNGITKGVNV